MSVSDPMIKNLKGCAVEFLNVSQPLTDESHSVRLFSESLEQILRRGLLVRINTFGYWRDPEPWNWMERLALNKFGAPYMYQLSVEKVRKCEKVRTNVGRLRLLIRHCLNNRCLHIPFQLLLETKQFKHLYGRESVLGSEILSQILLSVLLLPCRLRFKLDTDNARFLDEAWELPTARHLTFVPAGQLGLSLTFIDGKAIAVEVLPDSVASEDDQIEVGDVLDELNSVVVSTGHQGCLIQVLRKNAGHPITAYVIKARHKDSLYGPLVPLLRRAGLNPTQLLKKAPDDNKDEKGTMTYMGRVLTADRGDVREIRRAVNQLLGEETPQESVAVSLECHDMGVTVTQLDNNKVLMKHLYMHISSCGCTVQVPNYFAYIVEDRDIDPDNRFVCHIFHAENQEQIDYTLTSIDASTILFADDTTITVSHPDRAKLEGLVDVSLREAEQWFMSNGLMMNSSKSQLLHFATRSCIHQNLQNSDMDIVSSARFLGVVVDRNINWKDHVSFLVNKLQAVSFMIKVLSPVVDHETLMTVYYAQVYSHLRYGVVFWGDSVDSGRVFKIQKKIIRVMFQLQYRQSCKPFFIRSKILPLASLYIFELMCFLKSNPGLFLKNQISHSYQLRHDVRHYPVHRLALYEKGAYYSGLKLFNRLPEPMKQESNPKRFRRSLRDHLASQAYYNVKEYLDNEKN